MNRSKETTNSRAREKERRRLVKMNTIGKKLPFQRFIQDSEDSYEETSTTSDGTQGEGELNNPTLEQIKKQMGLFSSNVDQRKKLQIETVG